VVRPPFESAAVERARAAKEKPGGARWLAALTAGLVQETSETTRTVGTKLGPTASTSVGTTPQMAEEPTVGAVKAGTAATRCHLSRPLASQAMKLSCARRWGYLSAPAVTIWQPASPQRCVALGQQRWPHPETSRTQATRGFLLHPDCHFWWRPPPACLFSVYHANNNVVSPGG
jgi:hypothetical protein